ncbi:Gfo/Idh/MocA family oxidoreductase [Actinopolymorpha singaporensis]|uniref:Oxidoreductase family, NAD-binding Rossmann fold n=1 Tax=Actinopolymorpha singaporensis TaxID=117157 RepID=A0A1H1LDC9_9ACTN|nr:Gfo/Idh/MocA family oxidoreductase [Actinopolymorpha singaporensis]SDR72350.1 Oxidoreductase family, NAD-binding Rossmann fold [Actinopolymorpha singaporensis]
MRRRRAAIVGTGGIAGTHARALRAYADQVEIVAATDLDAGRLAAFTSQWEIPGRYPSLGDLLAAEQPDLVHLCTPPGAHAAAVPDARGVRRISAQAPRLARDVETEDVSFAHLTFANGAVASIVNSVLSPREESYLRFDFAGATLELSHLYGHRLDSWTYTPAPGFEQDAPPWPPSGEEVPSGHQAQFGELFASLRDGRRPAATGAGLRRTLESVTGIYASAFTGRRVTRDGLTADSPFYHRLNGSPASRARTVIRRRS